MAEIQFPKITEEALEDLRRRIDAPIEPPPPHVTEATRDTIRHYAHGIGDDNPLWTDEAYAQKTKHGGLIAPPTVLYAFDRIVSGYVGGLPGIHAMYAGTEWEWFRVIRVGDRISAKSFLKALIEKSSSFANRAIQQIYTTEFFDQAGDLVARADSWCMRTERDTARQKGKYQAVPPTRYSPQEIEKIKEDYQKEVCRGATPRFYEDVEVGEKLPWVVKGPMTPTMCIAYAQGWGGLYIRAHRLAFDMYEKHPALGIPNPEGVPEPPERVHWDSEFARMVGVPAAFDYGPERVSWMGHLVTNWMGNDGFLKELKVQVRRHNILGDTTWCQGEVTGKEIKDGTPLVYCRLWADNQRQERSVAGTATMVLPRRAEK
jgi:acyl dehydratase